MQNVFVCIDRSLEKVRGEGRGVIYRSIGKKNRKYRTPDCFKVKKLEISEYRKKKANIRISETYMPSEISEISWYEKGKEGGNKLYYCYYYFSYDCALNLFPSTIFFFRKLQRTPFLSIKKGRKGRKGPCFEIGMTQQWVIRNEIHLNAYLLSSTPIRIIRILITKLFFILRILGRRKDRHKHKTLKGGSCVHIPNQYFSM